MGTSGDPEPISEGSVICLHPGKKGIRSRTEQILLVGFCVWVSLLLHTKTQNVRIREELKEAIYLDHG